MQLRGHVERIAALAKSQAGPNVRPKIKVHTGFFLLNLLLMSEKSMGGYVDFFLNFCFVFFVCCFYVLLYVAPSSYVCCSRYCQILFFYGWQSYWFKPCIIRTTYWCRIEFSKYWSRPESCHKKLHLPDTWCFRFWMLEKPMWGCLDAFVFLLLLYFAP